MFFATPLNVFAIVATALLSISASGDRTAKLHQTTREEILQRATRTSSRVRRAATSVSAAPALINEHFTKFYSGSGYTENENNPSNNYPGVNPQTTTFPGTQSTPNAVQSCANYADDAGFLAFQIYYLNSQDIWTCEIYYEDYDNPPYLSDASYFNVANNDADPVFGYQYYD